MVVRDYILEKTKSETSPSRGSQRLLFRKGEVRDFA
jgi:hypothetical protein